MLDRRRLLGWSAGSLAAGWMLGHEAPWAVARAPDVPRKRIAIVSTVWRYRSHTWHMGERFLRGYPRGGTWHRPPIDVVSAFVDQVGADDLSRARAEEFGFTIYPTIAETLRCGGKELAVDGVLLIGEHGNYPDNELGQKEYPRYEFFQEIAQVFREDGRALPVFNDKHLSWKWQWAKEMVETSRSLGFPLVAGSSLPVTWRMPAVDVPHGAELEEALGVAMGPIDVYDFHGLEMVQCMVERRAGGETGVAAVEALSGDAFWKAMDKGSLAAGGWDARLFEACLSRSQTLAQSETTSHAYPTREQMQKFAKNPRAYRIEYRDGLRATLLMLDGIVDDFTFAARIRGQAEPLSTLFYLPPRPNVVYSAALMSKAEEAFLTGATTRPIERTLLTSGLVGALLSSLASGKRETTPQLDVRYTAAKESEFWRE